MTGKLTDKLLHRPRPVDLHGIYHTCQRPMHGSEQPHLLIRPGCLWCGCQRDWQQAGLGPVDSCLCLSLPSLFPKNSDTGLGLVSVPTTGDCTNYSHTANLGTSASPQEKNELKFRDACHDGSLCQPSLGSLRQVSWPSVLVQDRVSLHLAPQATHTPLSTWTPVRQGQGGSLTSGRQRTLQYFTPFRSLWRRT